ncbi:hypothetical protein HK405_013083, partial [Cladochytrium tenue]
AAMAVMAAAAAAAAAALVAVAVPGTHAAAATPVTSPSYCFTLTGSQLMSDFNGYSLLKNTDFNETTALDMFLNIRLDTNTTYVDSFKSSFGCTGWDGTKQRYHQSYYQGLLIFLSQNQGVNASCPAPTPNTMLCQSTCLLAAQALSSIFANMTACPGIDPGGVRASSVAFYKTNLTQFVYPSGFGTNTGSSGGSGISKTLIIGLAAGGGGLLLILAGVGVWFFIIRRRRGTRGVGSKPLPRPESSGFYKALGPDAGDMRRASMPAGPLPAWSAVGSGGNLPLPANSGSAGAGPAYYYSGFAGAAAGGYGAQQQQQQQQSSVPVVQPPWAPVSGQMSAPSSAFPSAIPQSALLSGAPLPGGAPRYAGADAYQPATAGMRASEVPSAYSWTGSSSFAIGTTDPALSAGPSAAPLTATTADDGFSAATPGAMSAGPGTATDGGSTAEGGGVGGASEATTAAAAAAGLFRMRVVYDYEATMADELSLQPGETVTVTAVFDDGWGHGVVGDARGAFPLACVAPLDGDDAARLSAAASLSAVAESVRDSILTRRSSLQAGG